MREVTGLDAIAWTDAQATLYRPGDFLTTHDDETGGHKRLAAYVLNMTPGWRPDWGGILQFLDERGNIEEGYSPAFNAPRLPDAICFARSATFSSASGMMPLMYAPRTVPPLDNRPCAVTYGAAATTSEF